MIVGAPRSTDTIYFGGRPIARLSAGQWTDLIYGPSGLLAEVPGSENAQPAYRLLDHLGTAVGTVGSNGLLTNPLDYTPFGQVFSGSTNDPYQFTGKERDTESGLDYFGARYMSSGMGRFMSPDWAAKAEPVPYAKLDDPQSLNLYAYVGNNPLSRIDADGHDCGCGVDWDQLPHDRGFFGPPPKNANGTDAAPRINLPPGKNGGTNGWKPVSDNPNGTRQKWVPIDPIPGQSQPSASWNSVKDWWSVNDGKGGQIQHVGADGNLLDANGTPVTNPDGSPAKPSLMQGNVSIPGLPGFGTALDLAMKAVIFGISVQQDWSNFHVPPPPPIGGTPGFPVAPLPFNPIIFAIP